MPNILPSFIDRRTDINLTYTNFVCLTGTTPWPWMSTEPCTSPWESGLFSITAITVVSSTTSTTILPAATLSGFDIYAYNVQIRWQNTDITTSTTTSMVLTSGTTPTLPTSTIMPTLPTHPATTPAFCGSNSLSAGAKAGMGISIVVFLGIIIGALIYFRRRQRLRQRPAPATETEASSRKDNDVHALYLKPALDANMPSQNSESRNQTPYQQAKVSELPVPFVPEVAKDPRTRQS